jgi:hypothetical protein
LIAVLAVLGAGCGAGEIEDPDVEQRLDTIRRATLKYRDRNVALKDGYRPLPRCVESLEGDGALGLEYIQLRLARDDEIDLLEPEQLFYEEQPGGKPPVLVGVGYFVPDEGQKPPSSPLGHLDGPIPAQYRGQDPHYELHAWVHGENPDGVLAFFNPDVSCLD